MDIQASKIELVKMILNIDNDLFIKRIFEFVKSQKVDFWDELTVEQKDEINEGIRQLEKGESISYADFLKKIS
jgi:hypothetical protein